MPDTINPKNDAIEALVSAAREFVRKVESGEAHSVKSYAAFKSALLAYDHTGNTNAGA